MSLAKSSKRLVLIDGHALIHRAYHAYPKSLTTTKGELVNAVYGFAATLLSTFEVLKPTHVGVAFDLKGPTFRHKEFADYKATRPQVDEDLIEQVGRVKEVVKALNIPILSVPGYEADDVIGTVVKKMHKLRPGQEVIVATGDKDILQLLDKGVRVFFPGRGRLPAKVMKREEFKKTYGFTPKQLVDFKALAGDQSDNIPGVAGIGPKKATKLVKIFGSIEELYRQLNKSNDKYLAEKSGLSVRDIQKLRKSQEQAELSKRLATIDIKVPLKFKLSRCRLHDYDKDEAKKLFEELEFRSLLKKLPGLKVKQTKKAKKVKPKDRQMELF